MRPYLSGFFDTNSGPKNAAASYKDIALSIGADSPSQLLFATGVTLEVALSAVCESCLLACTGCCCKSVDASCLPTATTTL